MKTMPEATRFALACLAILALAAPAQAASLDDVADAVAGRPDFVTQAAGSPSASSMVQASGVAEDPVTGELWVADLGQHRVLRFASAAGFANGEAANLVLGQADFTSVAANRGGAVAANTLNFPIAVAVDGAGRLYVADTGNHRVLVFHPPFASGMAAKSVVGQGDFTSNAANRGGAVAADTLNSPRGLALDRRGDLYVADFSNNRVLRFPAPAATGAQANKVFGQGSTASFATNAAATTATGLSGPYQAAADADGHLWVADFLNNRVVRYDQGTGTGDGSADRVLCQAALTTATQGTTASTCRNPSGVAVDQEGVVYVADRNNNRVLRFTTLTTGANAIAALGQADLVSGTCNRGLAAPAADTLCNPVLPAIDRSGNLLVGDDGNGRALRYDVPRPRVVAVISSLSPDGVPTTTGDFTLTVNGTGFYQGSVVTVNGLARPTQYLSRNRLLAQVAAGTLGGAPNLVVVTNPVPGGGFSGTTNLSLYIRTGMDGSADRVLGQRNFSESANAPSLVGTEVLGLANAASIGTLPRHVAVDPVSGRLFLADAGASRVMSWPSAAAFHNGESADVILGQADEFTTLSPGCAGGAIDAATLCGPYGLATDRSGHLFVSDRGNHRVLRFVPPFSTGMAATQVFGQGGVFDTRVENKGGISAESLSFPGAVAAGDTALFVHDAGNRRILVYPTPSLNATAGAAIGQAGLGSFETGSASATRFPSSDGGLALDAQGRLWFAETQSNRVVRFSPPFTTNMPIDLLLGQVTPDNTGAAAGATGLSTPFGIAFDRAGGLLVADAENHRVVRYAPPFTSSMAATGLVGQAAFDQNGSSVSRDRFTGPLGLATSPAGGLFVADLASRLLAFDRPFATPLAPADTSGDGKTELVWRATDGGFAVWTMDALAITGFSYGVVGAEWSVAATGDFNGDGKADLFWRRNDGALYVWYMDGRRPVAFTDLGVVPLEFTPVAVADFDGNGKADVLFRRSTGENYLWLMNDGGILAQGFVGPTLAAEWTVQGAADANGDGRADILWRNGTTGETWVWTMNGLAVTGAAALAPTLGADWQVQGLADFSGDGKADVLWRRDDGDIYLWTLDGTAVAGYQQVPDAGPEWVIQGLGDLDADGKPDIVFRNAGTGEVYIWLMEGAAFKSGGSLGNPGAIWTIAQPRR
jgi:sugar lactone lactonase YvrE